MSRAFLVSILAAIFLVACGGTTATGGSNGTGTGSGGGTTTTTATTGFGGHPPLGQPLTAPSEQWTWVDFPNTACGNGTPTGLAVNLTTKSSRVLIYLEGGGACWSDITCYTLMTAAHFTTGYGQTAFATDQAVLALPGGFFDRSAAANPFKDYSYVYIPYCTGDVFAGNNVMAYPSGMGHHVGYANMTAYLERIVPTFPSAERVYIAGSSAGGLGAAYNWWQTQQFFGTIRVDLIDDSGTPMPPDIEAKGMGEAQPRAVWNIASTLPAGCSACMTSLSALIGFYVQEFPDHRGALLSYVNDSVLPNFYQITTAQFAMGLNELLATYFKPNPELQSFTVDASGHVLWFGPTMAGEPAFLPQLQQFLTQMVTDDKAWASQAL
jgi:hypothetical protein